MADTIRVMNPQPLPGPSALATKEGWSPDLQGCSSLSFAFKGHGGGQAAERESPRRGRDSSTETQRGRKGEQKGGRKE